MKPDTDSPSFKFWNKPVVCFGKIADKILFTQIVLIGAPALVYYSLLTRGNDLLSLRIFFASFCILLGAVLFLESVTVARWARAARKTKTDSAKQAAPVACVALESLPRCSIIVVAYLPNEQEIVLESLDYLLHNIKRPAGGLEILLAYNTPVELPVEEELRRLAAAHPELRLSRSGGSSSKAEDLNAAIAQVTGELTCILDTDHQPVPDCLQRAWYWLDKHGYDVVQGRNIIRNHKRNFLTRFIAVEFECLFGITHTAKSLLVDMAIFGGTNGYWRTSVLREICFRRRMTEDIDATARTQLAGYRMKHDRDIISTELAPESLPAWWSQRKRWSQGWLEVSAGQHWSILRSDCLKRRQKCFWTYHLLYLQVLPFLALQNLSLNACLVLTGHVTPPHIAACMMWVANIVTAMMILGPLSQTLVAMRLRNPVVPYPPYYFLMYFLTMPLYAAMMSTVLPAALYDHLTGKTEWVITPRSARPTEALPAEVLTPAEQLAT